LLFKPDDLGSRVVETVIPAEGQPRSSELGLSRPVPSSVVSIAGREIGSHLAPCIVAELSCNHNGSIEKAKQLILAAKDAGADAVKLQTYRPDELTTREHPDLWELYEVAQTPRAWHRELFDFAARVGITIFSSAFSVEGVKFLKDLGSPAIKIASAEINDRELIDAARKTGLPVIISTGMASWNDIPWRLENVILLHCIAQYPSRIEDANLKALLNLGGYSRLFGLSDHTPGYETAIAATALGAVMIEKHFKLDDDCIDAAYSLNPEQFAAMCKAVRAIWQGMGDGVFRRTCEPRKR
jgi:sialic acid synthase SpsE